MKAEEPRCDLAADPREKGTLAVQFKHIFHIAGFVVVLFGGYQLGTAFYTRYLSGSKPAAAAATTGGQ